MRPGESSSCVLVVGTTGTGKTSLTNIYTGSSLAVGHSAMAETGATITVEDKRHPGAPVWVDNPGGWREVLAQQTPAVSGWSDTEGRSDAAVFKELLGHLQEKGIHFVAAVVWCILPQLRMDAVLQAQARWTHSLLHPSQVYRHVHSSR